MNCLATLAKRETADGCPFVKDDVPIGKVYRIWAPGTTKPWLDRRSGAITQRLSVRDLDSGGWLPAELLTFLD